MTLTTHITGVVCHPCAKTWYILPVCKIWRLLLQPFWKYDCRRRHSNGVPQRGRQKQVGYRLKSTIFVQYLSIYLRNGANADHRWFVSEFELWKINHQQKSADAQTLWSQFYWMGDHNYQSKVTKNINRSSFKWVLKNYSFLNIAHITHQQIQPSRCPHKTNK